jgi:hypothetical protein
VQVRAVHRLAPAAECDAARLDADAVYAEGAQLTLDDRLEPRRGGGEQVEPVRDRLTR